MGQIAQIAGICMVAALLALTIRKGSPEISLLLSLAAVTVVLLSLAAILETLVSFLEELGEQSGLPAGLFVPLYKTVGIALIVNVGGNLCRDAGESAVASALETAGAICALLAALPLLRTALELLLELMQ